MILKNIFGKTLEAAKKSAYQMYGDDILILEASEATMDGKEAKITIFSDHASTEEPEHSKSFKNVFPAQDNGVQFERSGLNRQPRKTNGNGLESLRKYATEQILTDKKKEYEKTQLLGGHNREQFLPPRNDDQEKTSSSTYRRSTVRNITPVETGHEDFHQDGDPQTSVNKPAGKFITHFRESKPQQPVQALAENSTPRADKRAIKALHKRFDRIESLLDSALISANLDYASHPAFQQLVATGISTSTIAHWFSSIIKTGIDPFDQPGLFMAKLAGILRDSLGKVVTKKPEKFMLFAGPSGSGKTSTIMKLCLHPDVMLNKKAAVVSINPQAAADEPYYTILEPFCRDNDLPFYSVNKGLDVNEFIDEWKEFDHVLIDTPSLSTESEDSFRNYWKIRQILTPVSPLEVHYVVNVSRNRFYFKNARAKNHPMQPDYVTLTHLDEVKEWGSILPFIKELGCNTRYISKGTGLPTSLAEFDPKWFAQHILETN